MSSADTPDLTKYQDPTLTPADIKAFEANRKSYFRGTIAVSIIYGVLAVGLFLLAIFSYQGRAVITADALPFTVTFILGIVLIIAALVISVTTAKPVHVPLSLYDSQKCPDYWTLSPTAPNVLTDLRKTNPQLALAYAYKCTPPPATTKLNQPAAKTYTPAGGPGNLSPAMKDTLSAFQGPAKVGTTDVVCDTNYPQYLYLQDMNYTQGNADPTTNNFVRCQVAKSCGYTWTAACPSVPQRNL